jgi:putative redox protein
MVSIQVQYEGDLRCRAVHGPSGIELFTDAPVDNHGRGESFSPTDLVATALATCMATVIGIKAAQKDLPLTGMSIGVEKHMSDDMPRRIVRLPVSITVPLSPEHPDRRLIEAVALSCPVYQSLHPDIDKSVTWTWNG